MTTITLEVPDELANQLAPLQERLPELLSLAVDLFSDKSFLSTSLETDIIYPVFQEVINFLISRPTPEQIVAFKVSPAVQSRLEALLDKNREDNLTDDEMAELDTYEQVNHLLILLKAHVRSTLSATD